MNGVDEPVSPLVPMPRQKSKPLLPVRGVCSLIGKDEDQVLKLIKDGGIAWAFNVALDAKRGRNRHLRILPAAVADFMHGRTCLLKWPDVLGLMLPDAPMMLASDITRVLNVSCDHVYHLIDRKQIIADSTRRQGPGGSARVPAKSFVQFLQARRLT
jgi:hypothetical protein